MNKSSLIHLSAALAMILMFSSGARADSILTLTSFTEKVIGPQNESSPCIIAGTECQNPAGFDFTNFQQKGSIPAYDEVSPVYDISDFPFLVFNVAVDVNTAGHGETLDLFEVWLGAADSGTRLYHYDGGEVIGLVANNGNGWGDWTLGIVNLSSFDADQTIQFHAKWHDASDGAESFFIVSTTAPPPSVPEPTSLLLLGTGLSGLGLAAWRKRKA